jgi:DhnA family fructose-bisphosphate aldolase class Ia
MTALALTEKVKRIAVELGADLIGVANVERLEGQPKGVIASFRKRSIGYQI